MDVSSLRVCTWLLLLAMRARAELHTMGGNHPVYRAEVGDEITITCPCRVEDGCLADGIFNWTKSPELDSEKLIPLFFFEKMFELQVRSARDGGYYHCFPYDQKDTTWLVELRVQPTVEIKPSGAGIGIHTGKSATLHCVGSGFPRPHVVWATPHGGGLQQTVSVVDEYSVSNRIVIESALQSMSGLYKCQSCYSDDVTYDGSCSSVEDEIHTSVFIYAECKVQLISQFGHELKADHSLSLECRVMCNDRLTYSVIWKHNSVELQSDSSGYIFEKSPPSYSLTMNKVNVSHAGCYSCAVRSIYKEEEAMDSIDIKVIVENGYPFTVTVITGVSTAVGVCFCAAFSVKKCKTSKNRVDRRGRTQASGRDVRRIQQDKISFSEYARQHEMNFQSPSDSRDPI